MAQIIRLPFCPSPPPALASIDGLVHVNISGLCSGIYFLCDGMEVVYVGQSVAVFNRVSSHMYLTEGKYDYKKFDHARVYYVPCPKDELTETERYWIRTLRPKYNRAHKPAEEQQDDPLLVA